jgi:lysophospholipase L1-like esterase
MQRLQPTLRGRVGSLLLALGATTFALGAGEAVVRGLSLAAPPESAERTPLPPAYRNLPELRSVGELTTRAQRGVFRGVLHRTNSQGVRGPDYSPKPPRGTFRIAVVGDSYTMGQGVEEQDTYPAVVESLLNAREDGRRYEVINLGVAGLAIQHSMRRLERVGLGYQPHLIVYGFTPNDIMGDDYREPSPLEQAAAKEWIGRFDDSPLHLLRLLWPRLVLAYSALWPLPGTYEHVLEENYFRNPKAAARFTEGLDRLSRLANSRGVCGHVFVHTRMNQLAIHPFERIYRWVAEAARERGLSAYVSLPHFRGRDASALRLSVVDTHPNAQGHRLHAEALVAGLDRLPAHCLAPGHFE